MRERVKIVEIGPRDGFQSVKEMIPTELKIQVVEGLAQAGFKRIQCTSFVSPKHIPQMQDAAAIAQAVIGKYPDVEFFALVPNFRGAQSAVAAGLREVTPVISLSVSHNKANVNRTHEQSLEEFKRIRDEYPDLILTPDIATVFGCPFEGIMSIPPLIDLIGRLSELGVREITLCDTIGVAYPKQVRSVLTAAKQAFPSMRFGLHIHDTRNMGMINSYEGIKSGADSVQTAVAGLGGCPFAPGASGNTASEDLVYMLECEGYDTGIDQPALLEVARLLHKNVHGNYSGHHINISVNHDDFKNCVRQDPA